MSIELLPQGRSVGRSGEVAQGLSGMVRAVDPTKFRVAMAYVSATGVERVTKMLATASPGWKNCRKRWLVGMDYGRSDPDALEALADLPKSHVRVFDGAYVVERPSFRPRNVFHPKIYIANNTTTHDYGLCLGSGNLTASGSFAGIEANVNLIFRAPGKIRAQRTKLRELLDWYRELWERSSPLDDVIVAYRNRWTPEFNPPEEALEESDILSGRPSDDDVAQALDQFQGARAFWVETHKLYENLTTRGLGNQLDLPRGTRTFFGFTVADVDRNTPFGTVRVHIPGYEAVDRTMRFGNNFMDKFNLPIPGRDGPEAYDYSYIVFEKTPGSKVLRLHVVDAPGLSDLKKKFARFDDQTMKGGRAFGLLY